MKELVRIFCPILAGWLWSCAISPLISRLFSIPARIGFLTTRRNQHLTRLQFIFAIGVFGWGVGMFIAWTGWYLLGPALFFVYPPSPTLQHILGYLLVWLSAGAVIGMVGAPRRLNAIH